MEMSKVPLRNWQMISDPRRMRWVDQEKAERRIKVTLVRLLINYFKTIENIQCARYYSRLWKGAIKRIKFLLSWNLYPNL